MVQSGSVGAIQERSVSVSFGSLAFFPPCALVQVNKCTPCAPRSVWCVLLLVFCALYSMAYVYSTVYCDYSTPCAVMHCRSVHTTQFTPCMCAICYVCTVQCPVCCTCALLCLWDQMLPCHTCLLWTPMKVWQNGGHSHHCKSPR